MASTSNHWSPRHRWIAETSMFTERRMSERVHKPKNKQSEITFSSSSASHTEMFSHSVSQSMFKYHPPIFISVYIVVCFVCFCLILYGMCFYYYVYVFLLLCMFCSVYSVFIVPTGTLLLPWLTFFRAFSSVVRQMPRYNSQRRGTARALPN